ncbi:MAG: hypothetical protein Fur005_15290 [Roseiflexaceae bacterium]
MSDQPEPTPVPTTPPPAQAATPDEEAPEVVQKRLIRGCTIILLLLVMITVTNFLQYRFNIVTIIAGVLLIVAAIGRFVLSLDKTSTAKKPAKQSSK